MELRTLKYFVAAYETGSITAASDRCHVAQPSISQAIQKLEGELHCTLFTRDRNGVTATNAGNILYKRACRLLHDSQQIIDYFKPRKKRKNIALNLSVDMPLQRLHFLLSSLTDFNHKVCWQIVRDEPMADIWLCTEDNCPTDYEFKAIWQDDYVLLTPQSYQLDIQSLTLEKLQQLDFIEPPMCKGYPDWLSLQQQLGVKLNTSAQANIEEWAKSLVASGVGICISPAIEAYEGIKSLRINSIPALSHLPSLTRRVGLGFSANMTTDLQVQLIDCLTR